MIDVQEDLEYTFHNIQLLKDALTHPSVYAHKKNLPTHHFERLEFIGDRVLALSISDLLYQTFPQINEGEMARRLAWLVCRDTLAKIATDMRIHKYIKYSRANDRNLSQWKTFLSDACEALIGAIYLDGGFMAAQFIIKKFWSELLHEKTMWMKDPKSTLQEYTQGQFKQLPVYRMVGQIGPAHHPEIIMECDVNGVTVQAKASSKKIAEQECAKLMLTELKLGYDNLC